MTGSFKEILQQVQEMPSWLVSLATSPRNAIDKTFSNKAGQKTSPNWMSEYLAKLAPGNRHDTFVRIIGKMHHEGTSIDDIIESLKVHAEKTQFDLGELRELVSDVCNRYPNNSIKPTDAALEARFQELAALPLVEYDPQRKQAAEQLGLRAGTLDAEVEKRRPRSGLSDKEGGLLLKDPEPWDETVNGSVLLSNLVQTLTQFIVMPEHMPLVAALWVIFTYCHDAFQISPILCVSSPEKRCGKSTFLSLLGMIVRRPLLSSNVTTAVIYRVIGKCHPTLIIDEADTFLAENRELTGVINSGHRRDMAYVLRSVGDDHEPTQFPTWAAKIIGLIGELSTTLLDRAINVGLRRRLPGETIKRLHNNQRKLLTPIRRQCLRWANDNFDSLSNSDPVIPEGLNDRAVDNWTPLYAIADLVGGEWPHKVRMASICLNHEESEDAASIILLQDIQKIATDDGLASIPTAALLEKLGALEDHPWPEWNRGKPIKPRQIARLLRPFGIRPKGLYGGKKGYIISHFADAFARYIPILSAIPLTFSHDGPLDQPAMTKSAHEIADIFTPNPPKDNNNRGIADKTDEPRDEDGEVVDEI